jgi:hypothetical protein
VAITSCNPEALAHDLRLISQHSYVVRSLQPVDMFLHTAHVETVAILDRSRRWRSEFPVPRSMFPVVPVPGSGRSEFVVRGSKFRGWNMER